MALVTVLVVPLAFATAPLLAVEAGGGEAESPQPPGAAVMEPGFLVARSVPAGAYVYVDSALIGRAPAGPQAVGAGRHEVWFRTRPPEEFEPEPLPARTIDIASGDTVAVEEEVGQLVWIESDPSDATVLVEGRHRGRTPLLIRWFGSRDRGLMIEREGYERHAVVPATPEDGRIFVRLDPVGKAAPGPVERGGPGAGLDWKALATLGLCAVAAGSAVWFKEEADDAYARYERAAIPDEMREHLDEAERYDRYSTAAWVTAETSFVVALWILARPVLGLGVERAVLAPRAGSHGPVFGAEWQFP